MTDKSFKIAMIQSWIKQGMGRQEAVDFFNEAAAFPLTDESDD